MKSSKYLDTLFNTFFNIQTYIWQNLQCLCTLQFYNIILHFIFDKTFTSWANARSLVVVEKWIALRKKIADFWKHLIIWTFQKWKCRIKGLNDDPSKKRFQIETRWGYSSIENLGYSLRYNCKILLENISFKLLFWDTYFFISFFSYTLIGDHFMLLLFVISHCKVLQGKIFSKNLFL